MKSEEMVKLETIVNNEKSVNIKEDINSNKAVVDADKQSLLPWPGWVSRMSMSATAHLEQTIERLKTEGREIIALGLGEPDFGPPEHVRQAAITAIENNFGGYTATGGILSLKEAICHKLLAASGAVYATDEVMASIGGKHVLFNALLALLREGEEVIIPMPYWVSFPEQVKFAKGEPVLIQTSAADGYKLKPEQLEAVITPRSRVVILNSPNNPSGAAYGEEELEAIAAVCRKFNLWVISDEVYADFCFRAEGHKSIAALPGMKKRTVVVHSLSKGYGMPGWRLGCAAAPRELIEVMTMLQSHTTSNPPTLVQRAAIAALTGPQTAIQEMSRVYRERLDTALQYVREVPGFSCEAPEGAFFVWVDISAWIGQAPEGRAIENAESLCGLLLERCSVALMPGSAFGSANHIRLSFSATAEALRLGLTAVRSYLEPYAGGLQIQQYERGIANERDARN